MMYRPLSFFIIVMAVQAYAMLLCSLDGCPPKSVIAGSRAEYPSHDTADGGIGLDFLSGLLALTLEARLMTFEARSGSVECFAIRTVVGGIGALSKVDHNNAIIKAR